MSNKKISELTADDSTVDDDALLPIVEGSTTKKTKRSDLQRRTVRAVTGAANTAALADRSKHLTTSHGSANALTIPPVSSVAYTAGDELEGTNIGAGLTTLTAGAGVTLNGRVAVPQRAKWRAKYVGSDVWECSVTPLLPTSATDQRVAVFSGTSGNELADGGKTVAEIIYAGVAALTGAANTLAIGHAQQAVTVSHTAATQLTVPPNSSVAFPTSTLISVTQVGAGKLEILAGGGVTLRYSETLFAKRQYSTIWLRKIGTDEWMVWGELESRGLQYLPAVAATKGLWTFNGTLNDSSGLGHNLGISTGTIEYSDVFPGKRFAWFDAATRLTVAHADLQITGAITIQAAMILDAGPNGNPWISHSAAGETEAANIIYEAQIETGRLLTWFSEHSTGTNDTFSWAAPDALPAVHQLFFLSHTRSSGGTIQNYVNGRPLGASQALTLPTGGTSGALYVGGNDASLFSQMFLGSLRIDAEERTAAQIASDYSYCLGGIYGDYVP